jgi:hypothetical protein
MVTKGALCPNEETLGYKLVETSDNDGEALAIGS